MLAAATEYVRPASLEEAIAADSHDSSERVYELLRGASSGGPRGVEAISR